jgi:iron(III) transport system substrate-binding protein
MILRSYLSAGVAFILSLGISTAVVAQATSDEWKAAVAAAKGQPLVVVHAEGQAYTHVLNEFGKKFGVDVQATVGRPSTILARIQTEQRNGQHVWDLWLGGTSNMVNAAAPAGLIEPLEKYFFLPEVKEPSNWRHADFIFNDSGRRAFAFVNKLEFFVMRNTRVLPEVKIESWDDLLNPKLKGKISSRDASVPNAAVFALATAYGAKGPDYLRKLFKDQDVKIFENPQQLDASIIRGSHAVAFGMIEETLDKCRTDGGCKDVELLRQFGASISTGMSVPTNPPHAAVVKLWINWFLSREGQQMWVDTWAKYNTGGAVSMRKDVAPAPGHEMFLPDFSKPEQYVFVSSEKGSKEVDATIDLYKKIAGQ